MRLALLLSLLIGAASVAPAQRGAANARLAAAPVSTADPRSYGLSASMTTIEKNDRIKCLIRKSDGRRECHTFDGWRAIAASLEKHHQ